ncbi:MAG: 16S rRNA (guanine(966)-N(2))-methyltransferase RsmD [Acidobacteriota bacterium]|nr:16S rRNA (guanine(966)-N(2))-methyltransferase RsmD [Acidobacteriota bacterium]
MRVIAGTYRSRPLQAPPGSATRPTADRLRETLFNVLQMRVAGSRVVDLYAGSGAVGIEALSRGASFVWFAENATAAAAAIRANLRTLGINTGYSLEERSVAAVLERLARLPEPVDLVFLDPPYEAVGEYSAALGMLGSQRLVGLLAADAIVVVEHRRKTPLAAQYGQLERYRELRQGDATLSFYRRATTDAPQEPSHPDADQSPDPR